MYMGLCERTVWHICYILGYVRSGHDIQTINAYKLCYGILCLSASYHSILSRVRIGRVLRTLDTMLYTKVLIVVLFELDHYLN